MLPADKIKIEINASSLEQPDLVEITTTYTPLIKLIISLPGPIDPGVALDQESMENLSKFFDFSEGIEKYFDCMRIEGDFDAYACPVPFIIGMAGTTLDFGQSTQPVDLVAGHDNVLIILGSCFGETRGESYVEFENAKDGAGLDEWIEPVAEDYIFWSDGLIHVQIPTIGLDNDDWYAGSGKVRVNFDDGGQTLIATSTTNIDVDFAVRNTENDGPLAIPPFHQVIQHLGKLNESGGYDLWYGEGMSSNFEAQASFESALLKWVCETNVNFEIKDIFDIDPFTTCEIKFDSLPTGTEITLAQYTPLNAVICNALDGTAYARNNQFSIRFNENLNWYYDESTDIDLTGANLFDFQSRALHELGHAIGLLHVNNEEDLMHYEDASPPLYFNREITPDALLGGQFLVQQAALPIDPVACAVEQGYEPMEPIFLNVLECTDLNSINEINNQSSLISIYPNPSTGIFRISDQLNRSQLQFEIQNVMGDVILRGSTNTKRGININHVSKGIYFIKVLENNSVIGTYKVMKD